MVAIEAQSALNTCDDYGCPSDWQWWRAINWLAVAVGTTSVFVGGVAAFALESPDDSLMLRFVIIALIPIVVAFPAGSIGIALLAASTNGLEGVVLFLSIFMLAMVVGLVKFGGPALVVTALCSLAYAGFARRTVR